MFGNYNHFQSSNTPFLGNLRYWGDASDTSNIIKDVSNLVSQLNDKSGLGNHMLAVGLATPLFVDAQQNGKSVLRFDGALSFMSQPILFSSGDFTYFIAYKYLTYTSGAKTLLANGDTTTGFSYRITVNRNHVNNAIAAVADGARTSNFEVVCVTRNTAPDLQFYLNNINQNIGGTTTAYNPATTGTFSLGGRTGATEFANFELGEVLVYDKSLSVSERMQTSKYLQQKWRF